MKTSYPAISYTFKTQPCLASSLSTAFYLPAAINDFGEIAGDLTLRGPGTAFTYDAGVVNTGVVSKSFEFSYLGGINDFGALSGAVTTASGMFEAILINHGTLQTFTYPGATATRATGINNFGQVAGYYVNASGEHGFAGTPGNLKPVDVPGASVTMAAAINDRGQIAGTYDDAGGTHHGFVDTNGHYATIDVPGAASTTVNGINDQGEIVGTYVDSANETRGFVLAGGKFQTLDVPGAFLTSATGINNLDDIVGYSETVSPSGSAPVTQVWVAKPSFIYGASGPDAGLAPADLTAQIGEIAEHAPGRPGLESLLADRPGGPAWDPVAAGSGVMSGPYDQSIQNWAVPAHHG